MKIYLSKIKYPHILVHIEKAKQVTVHKLQETKEKKRHQLYLNFEPKEHRKLHTYTTISTKDNQK